MDLQLQEAVDLLRNADSQAALFVAAGTPLAARSQVGEAGSP
jgi:hypothetical protein